MKKILIAIISLFIFLGALAGTGGKRKPNVIYILTDDQPDDSYGFANGKVATPNLDQLASEGVHFSNAYLTTSVCTPSRYSCITGQYPSRSKCPSFKGWTKRSGGQTFVSWNTHLTEEAPTAPKVLRQNGYATGFVGKWHLGLNKKTKDKWIKIAKDANPENPEIKKILDKNQKTLDEAIKKLGGFDYVASACRGNVPEHNSKNQYLMKQQNMEYITKGALDFIEQKKDQPFYLYFSTNLTHGPSALPALVHGDTRKYWGGTLEKGLEGVQPSRASVLERGIKAGLIEKTGAGEWRFRPKAKSGLLSMIWLDDAIGVLMKKLRELKLEEDTIVIFLTDHRPRSEGKGTLYNEGIKVPMLLRWTGSVKPSTSKALIQNIDFIPTMFDACGVTPPKEYTLDGVSLMPLLKGEKESIRNSAYAEVGLLRAVVQGDWKYIAYRRPPTSKITPEENQKRLEKLRQYVEENKNKSKWRYNIPKDVQPPNPMLGPIAAFTPYMMRCYDPDQLYNLKNDPKEQVNLAREGKNQEQLLAMKKVLQSHLDRLPGTFGELKTKSE